MKKLLMVFVSAYTVFSCVLAIAAQPDLRTLKNSGFIMGPGSASYPVDRSWQGFTQFMAEVNTYDRIVKKMESVLCSTNQNRSILLIGEPNDTYRYIFARMAARIRENCQNLWHVEIDINKIESGHSYVGQVEEYWEDKVLAPADNKDVILYFRNLGRLIGLGSHSNDTTGIEAEYAANINAGRLRTVAFINKYEYQSLLRTEYAHVFHAFAEKIVLEPIDTKQVDQIVQAYLKVMKPGVKLNKKVAEYLYRTIAYYQPNVGEPQRSMRILQAMLRPLDENREETADFYPEIESAHPYAGNDNIEYLFEQEEMDKLQISFESFETEKNYDKFTVYDGHSGETLDIFSGSLGDFRTREYNTNKLRMVFTSDSRIHKQGFKVKSVIGKKYNPYEFNKEEVRTAIFEAVQIPMWMLSRDYSIIRNLRANFDSDVVGVVEGKRDLVRLAKNGYVIGRTDEKPIGSVLFVGPTGVGKSYIAKKMAKFMELELITLDMTSYRSEESFDRFLDVVAKHLVINPFAIFLFEEIDKADAKILDRLYFMLDEGIFYDAYQRPLFARGSFVIMTTNSAKDLIIREQHNPNLRQLVNIELRKHFRASFLNRFDGMSIFYPFSEAEFAQLANIMVSKKFKQLNLMYDWKVSADDATMRYLATNGQSSLYGARPMERLIENVITTGLADFQLYHRIIPEGAEIQITKLAEEHMFRLTVDGDQMDYEVDPENNNGGNLYKMLLEGNNLLMSSLY